MSLLRTIIQSMQKWVRRLFKLERTPSQSPNLPISRELSKNDGSDLPTSGYPDNCQTENSSIESSEVGPRNDELNSKEAAAGNEHGKILVDQSSSSRETLVSQNKDKSSAPMNAATEGRPDPAPAEPESPLPSRAGSSLPEAEPEKLDPPPSQLADYQSTPTKDIEQPRGTILESSGHTEGKGKTKEPKPKLPRDIPGRRDQQIPKPESRPWRSPPSRPELICRTLGSSRQWEVVLSVDGDRPIVAVFRDEEHLDLVNRECRLSSLAGQLTIVFEHGQKDEIQLFDDKPLIFKLSNNWTGDGRKTGGITKGHFIVIAPNEWERTGHAPVEPVGCTDIGFTAHYFCRNGTEPTEDIGGFRECAVVTTSGFELIGERVFDDSEDGDLFVGTVPKLKLFPTVAWVRVGEEKENGWRGENFRPSEETLSEVLNGRQGRFFVRVYDSEVRLLDSGEFRYLRNLKEIRVNGDLYTENTCLVPPSTGHPPTKVRFIGIDGAAIHPILQDEVSHVTAREGDLVIEPHLSGDDISCALESDNGSVDIVLELPRVWWRMEQDGGELYGWRDVPLAMTRREFRRYADANATMRLRLPRRIESVLIGFDDELERMYRREREENNISVPLAHFVDYSQIDRRLNEDASFNVECAREVLKLIRISADPPPYLRSSTLHAIQRWSLPGSRRHCAGRHKTRTLAALRSIPTSAQSP